MESVNQTGRAAGRIYKVQVWEESTSANRHKPLRTATRCQMAKRRDLVKLLNDAETIIDDPDGTVTAGGLEGLLDKYEKLKPLLALIIPLLSKLPFFSKLGPILTLLMSLVDGLTE